MINLLFTISTAEGGFVLLLEDLVVHREYRGHGYGSMLLDYAIEFAKQKNFRRITLLDRSARAALAKFLPQTRLLRIAHAADAFVNANTGGKKASLALSPALLHG